MILGLLSRAFEGFEVLFLILIIQCIVWPPHRHSMNGQEVNSLCRPPVPRRPPPATLGRGEPWVLGTLVTFTHQVLSDEDNIKSSPPRHYSNSGRSRT